MSRGAAALPGSSGGGWCAAGGEPDVGSHVFDVADVEPGFRVDEGGGAAAVEVEGGLDAEVT